MTAAPRTPYEYAALRVIPRIERGEQINAGVILYSQSHDYLAALHHLDTHRLHALDTAADADGIRAALDAISTVCRGEPGQSAACDADQGRRFRWLTAPRSTIVQAGPIHTGLTADPAAELRRLLRVLVLPTG
ncbi:Protein of unknown function (DUF3037) [Murinocardiopsis flavida]|uniref:DUF3037 family protein n=1 Tax=Murinocardiopsis flavida TaxID=645275 RepID=A0A2P8D968_9ACTN|nr:DUF3037 domain-containing protein [Murinocardiopsis flavida]PSK93770.1 Protein of unknown function (DUF3037) [Murinocardiopsis flavida]